MSKPEIEYRKLSDKIEVIDRRGRKIRRYSIPSDHLVPAAGIVQVKVVPRSLMGKMKTTNVPPTADAPVRSQPQRSIPTRPAQRRPENSNQRIGDQVEAALVSIGITKERYAAAKAVVGLPRPCNCSERRAWLNRLDLQLGIGEKMADLKKLLKWGGKNA